MEFEVVFFNQLELEFKLADVLHHLHYLLLVGLDQAVLRGLELHLRELGEEDHLLPVFNVEDK